MSDDKAEQATGRTAPYSAADEVRRLTGTPLPDDFGDIPSPTPWARVPAADAPSEWEDLRAWVDELCQRFAFLDHHVVPRCWWRHNEHVEALSALRDHERSSFSDTSPATAPVEWFRAVRDIGSLLRSWTANLGCGPSHQDRPHFTRPVDGGEWEVFVAADTAARQAREIEQAAR